MSSRLDPPAGDPFARFADWFAQAKEVEPADPTATTLATADARGRPSARMVLLKGFDARGFVFFTNHESRKGHELAENPFAALCLYWPKQERQVRIEGPVTRVSDPESDAYFATRARGSQVGAWASQQSAEIASRAALEARVRETEARFPTEVPRPPFWGGYRLAPNRVEFWQGQPSRLHDREVFTLTADGTWHATRLSP